MIIRLGGQQSVEPVINEIRRVCAVNPLGALVQIEPIEPAYTRPEEAGFHLLLNAWLAMDRSLTFDVEQLKEAICKSFWGVVRLVGPGGQEHLIAAKRTTREWDHDKKRYRRKKLTVEQYAELIDHTYRMAATDGTLLPELDKEKAA